MKKAEIINNIFSLYEMAKNGKQIYDAPSGDGYTYYTVFDRMLRVLNSMVETPVKMHYISINLDDENEKEWATSYFMRHNKRWLDDYRVMLEMSVEKMNNIKINRG